MEGQMSRKRTASADDEDDPDFRGLLSPTSLEASRQLSEGDSSQDRATPTSAGQSKRGVAFLSEAEADVESQENGLTDPWNLVRIAMGSLAGESWRLKQALVWPTEAFKLRGSKAKGLAGYMASKGKKGTDSGGKKIPTTWDNFQKTQTFDNFKRVLPFRPNSTNNTIEFVVVGDAHKLDSMVHIEALLTHLEAFIGFPVHLREAHMSLAGLGDRDLPQAPQQPRGSLTGAVQEQQYGAHFVLAQLRSSADLRSVCTIGLTHADLYPPNTYEFVTGMTDASQRVAIYSAARYFNRTQKSEDNPDEETAQEGGAINFQSAEHKKELMTQCLIKMLCREALKLCRMEECHLLECLMNPFPGGPPENIKQLPLSLCCICLRKLQWLTQADLLDRYASLPAVLGDRFFEESIWIWERMVQVGMPTYASLRSKNSVGAVAT